MYILCGPYHADVPAAGHVVVADPIDYRLVCGLRGASLTLQLNDFTDRGDVGASADLRFFDALDDALLDESLVNSEMRWAPLAYLHVQLRISRFLTLRRALGNLVSSLKPVSLTVSSATDVDLLRAAESAARKSGIACRVESGASQTLTNAIYRSTPFSIPRGAQSRIVTWLIAWGCRLAGLGRGIHAISPEHLASTGMAVRRLKAHFYVDALRSVLAKFRAPSHPQLMLENDIALPASPSIQLKSPLWQQRFDDDEMVFIACILGYVFRVYANSVIDRVYANLKLYLEIVRPTRVVMSHDKIDFYRLIAYACNQIKIPVAYQPHGIVFEDYSGHGRQNPFSPSLILGWSEVSCAAYAALGWPVERTQFGPFHREPSPYRPLTAHAKEWKVLCLLPEWLCGSQEGREDCFLEDLFQTIEGLQRSGAGVDQLHFKFHRGPPQNANLKAHAMERAQDFLGARLTVLDPAISTANILGHYDLIVLSITTGIFEAIFAGIPLVIFGLWTNRAGGIRDQGLPAAETAMGLGQVLSAYDNLSVERTYGKIAASLRQG